MPKKRSPRQKKIAADAARREAHARMVVKRHGDPRYVQRQRIDDETVRVTLPDDPEVTERMRETLAAQNAAFRERFGREPGPEDPLFWDPDAPGDEPTPVGDDYLAKAAMQLAEAAVEAGIDPALVLPMRDLGYMVTEATEHTFSLAEVDAYEAAVGYYREFDDPLTAPPFDPQGKGGQMDGEAISPEEADQLMHQVSAMVIQTVEGVVRSRQARAGFSLTRMIDEFANAGNADAAGPAYWAHVSAAADLAYLVAGPSGGENGYDRTAALTWVRSELGSIAASAAERIADDIPTLDPSNADGIDALSEDLRDSLLPAFMWLLAGAVATAGQGDLEWLRRQAS